MGKLRGAQRTYLNFFVCRADLAAFEAELELLGDELAALKGDLVIPQENVVLGRSMLSDVGVMDQLFNDLKKVNAELDKTKRLIPAGGESSVP